LSTLSLALSLSLTPLEEVMREPNCIVKWSNNYRIEIGCPSTLSLSLICCLFQYFLEFTIFLCVLSCDRARP
jgi:hypothetical protein